METITIFYSWQSNIEFDINAKPIENAIKKAALGLEESYSEWRIVVDQATRDESGSPDIPTTIFSKISKADIVICDVTTVNNSDLVNRKMPNPNVMIELGYAIATLGWQRIILVFNKQFGTFPSDLPFDLDKRRVKSFTITSKDDHNGKADLASKMKIEIESIIKKNPSRPDTGNVKANEEIKRERDILNCQRVMKYIHIPTIENFLYTAPGIIRQNVFFYNDSLGPILRSSSFHLYDEVLKKHIYDFLNLWDRTLDCDQFYRELPSGDGYRYYIPADIFPSKESEIKFRKLTKDVEELEEKFKMLLGYIRINYLEVDLDKLSELALKSYEEHEAEMTSFRNSLG